MKYTPTEEDIYLARANAREILETIFDNVSSFDVYLLRELGIFNDDEEKD